MKTPNTFFSMSSGFSSEKNSKATPSRFDKCTPKPAVKQEVSMRKLGKPFSIGGWQESSAIITRSGQKVDQLTRFLTATSMDKLAGVVDGYIKTWNLNGHYSLYGGDSDYDLFFAPVKKTAYANLYRGIVTNELFLSDPFNTREIALNHKAPVPVYVGTVEINWEE